MLHLICRGPIHKSSKFKRRTSHGQFSQLKYYFWVQYATIFWNKLLGQKLYFATIVSHLFLDPFVQYWEWHDPEVDLLCIALISFMDGYQTKWRSATFDHSVNLAFNFKITYGNFCCVFFVIFLFCCILKYEGIHNMPLSSDLNSRISFFVL